MLLDGHVFFMHVCGCVHVCELCVYAHVPKMHGLLSLLQLFTSLELYSIHQDVHYKFLLSLLQIPKECIALPAYSFHLVCEG